MKHLFILFLSIILLSSCDRPSRIDHEDNKYIYAAWNGEHLEYMPADLSISHLDTIEDEDIRAVAESYMDEGYVLSTFDPYSTFYMYDYGYRGGFSGMYQDSTGFIEVWYFEGDEDLFERVDIPFLFGTETDRQDDGTLITITYVTTVVGETVEEQPTTLCYDRETGFITITSVYSNC